MFGNILQGSAIYGDKLLGISVTEVGADISESTAQVVFRCIAAFSSYHTKFRIPELDLLWDFQYDDGRFVPKIGIGAYGDFDEFGTELYIGVSLGAYTTFILTEIVASGLHQVGFGAYNDFISEHFNDNSIRWAKPGTVDFTEDQTNLAGYMPIDINGYVYAIKQLGTSDVIYAYTANGISRIIPKGEFFGNKIVSRVGLKGKHAVISTDLEQYFITKSNYLYKVSKNNELVLLGYKAFMENLTSSTVMSYDSYNRYIYICDGTIGYIYSEDSDSLVSGPANITGIGYQDDTQYVSAPTEITLPAFAIDIDTFDLGTNKEKTIFEVIVKSTSIDTMRVAIEYQTKQQDGNYATTPWVNIQPHGTAKIPCYARSFKLKIDSESISNDFSIDSITIVGVIHGYSFLDTITMK